MRITLLLLLISFSCYSQQIFVNQIGYDSKGPKMAVIETDQPLAANTVFTIGSYKGKLTGPLQVEEWAAGKYFYQADFSSFTTQGKYKLTVKGISSPVFEIGSLAALTIPSILHYYRKQRANTAGETAADKQLLLYGSDKRVDLRGGWCDASGDVSKYFSHLAYANFMSPQQIPLVTWSLINAKESIPKLLDKLHVKDSITDEALWGADYIMRSLSEEGYFYMTVFSYFKNDPSARRVVGLQANSVTTNDYQCAFREGGGMAIAALARISMWKKDSNQKDTNYVNPTGPTFTSAQYLSAAERAFAHLLTNNTKYDDDGKENIIDDYCALMAATELWIATDSSLYRNEARKRANNLSKRMSADGYFIADDKNRPFWHASDAGMPIIALVRYLKKEKDTNLITTTKNTIKKALDYNIRVTNDVSNPFGYARQSFSYKGKVQQGFFIPHENETGWWWQGENARLASLAAAAIAGGRIVYPRNNLYGTTDTLLTYASHQLSWILGCNPYDICFMYQFGKRNVPYMHSNYGHGSERGGISNGITGKDGNPDGRGIDFKTEAAGNEWRWTEQWIPHAAWFLQAITLISEE